MTPFTPQSLILFPPKQQQQQEQTHSNNNIDISNMLRLPSRKTTNAQTNKYKSTPATTTTNNNNKYSPGIYDVICGKGRTAFNHTGNKRFRSVVKLHLGKYSDARTKGEKSMIVTNIMRAVRLKGSANFIKLVNKNKGGGIYYDAVSERLAREKVGQALRDELHTQYKSSTEAKKQRRIAAKNHRDSLIHQIVQENTRIQSIMTFANEQLLQQQQLQQQQQQSSLYPLHHNVGNIQRNDSLPLSSDDDFKVFFATMNKHVLQELKNSNSVEMLQNDDNNCDDDDDDDNIIKNGEETMNATKSTAALSFASPPSPTTTILNYSSLVTI